MLNASPTAESARGAGRQHGSPGSLAMPPRSTEKQPRRGCQSPAYGLHTHHVHVKSLTINRRQDMNGVIDLLLKACFTAKTYIA